MVEATIHGTKGTLRLNSRFHEPTSISILQNTQEVERFEFEELGNGMQYEIEEVHRMLNVNKIKSDMMSWEDSLMLHQAMDEVRRQIRVSYE